MPRPEGLPKTGGRRKGTPNRKTEGLQEALLTLGVDVPSRIVELLPLLPKEKQIETLMDLMGFLFPKRRAVEAHIDVDAKQEVVKELNSDDRHRKMAQFNRNQAESVNNPELAAAFEKIANHYENYDESVYE